MSQAADIEELSGETPTAPAARRVAAAVFVAVVLLVAFLAGRVTAPTTSAAATPSPAASPDLVRPAWVSDALLQAFYQHPRSTSACTSNGGVTCLPLVGTSMDEVAWQGAVDSFWPRVEPQTVRAGRIVVAAPTNPGPTGGATILLLRPEQGPDSQPDGLTLNGRVFFFDLGDLRPGWYALITMEDFGPQTGVLMSVFGIIVS
jgi:hypothetical protein